MKNLKEYDAEYEDSGRAVDRTVWIYSQWLKDNGLKSCKDDGYLEALEEAEQTDRGLSAVIALGYRLLLWPIAF